LAAGAALADGRSAGLEAGFVGSAGGWLTWAGAGSAMTGGASAGGSNSIATPAGSMTGSPKCGVGTSSKIISTIAACALPETVPAGRNRRPSGGCTGGSASRPACQRAAWFASFASSVRSVPGWAATGTGATGRFNPPERPISRRAWSDWPVAGSPMRVASSVGGVFMHAWRQG
jgi:hypothetical protein